jgi:hypothetical protein
VREVVKNTPVVVWLVNGQVKKSGLDLCISGSPCLLMMSASVL